MRIKTMFIILATVLITVFLVQNSGEVYFSFLWLDFKLSKLLVLAGIAIFAFILGVLVGTPGRVKRLGGEHPDDIAENVHSDTLSDEDRDYISHD